MKILCPQCHNEISKVRLFFNGLIFKSSFKCGHCRTNLSYGMKKHKFGFLLALYSFLTSFFMTFSFSAHKYVLAFIFLFFAILGILYWYKKCEVRLVNETHIE